MSNKARKRLLRILRALLAAALAPCICIRPVLAAAPGNVSSNLQLWLKADDEAYNDAGSTLATDGQTVREWHDQDSNHDFSQGTSSNRPIFRATRINFNPAIDFDGSNDFMEDSDGENYVNGKSGYTSFVVFESDSASSDGQIFHTNSASDLVEAPWGLRFDASGVISGETKTLKFGVGTGSDTLYEIDESNVSTNRPMLVIQHWSSGGAPVIRIAGQSKTITPTTSKSGSLSGADYVRLGHETNSGSPDWWSGEIAEVVFYDANLSSTNRKKVWSYLALKYGITLDQSSARDYLASDGSTEMWDKDASGASTYNNDIAGIGRDDNSELGQVKTRSTNSDSIVTITADGEGSNASPSWTNIANLEFLTWANNNGSTSAQETSDIPPGIDSRLTREWLAQETGEVGDLTISFDLDDQSALTNTGETYNYRLLVDDDGTFSNAVVSTVTASFDGNEITFSGVHDINDGKYFTLGFIETAPGGVLKDLRLWFKADAGLDESDGGSVDRWEDQSAHSRAATQSTAANRPTFENDSSNTVNFNPVVDFDGANDVLSTTFDIGVDQFSDLTVYSVHVPDSNVPGAPWGNDDDGWDRFILDVGSINDAIATGTGGTPVNNIQDVTGLLDAGVVLATIQWDEDATNGSIGRVNGKTEATFTADQGPQTDSLFAVGWDGDDNNFDGSVVELAIYDSTHTVSGNKIESYLALKYAITLDATDYVDSGGTVLWDGDGADSSYHNDVAGIGQDDSSELDQKVAKSLSSDAIVTMATTNDFTSLNSDGSRASLGDGKFAVWGNNNGNATAWTTENSTDKFRRIAREWIIEETGSVGNIHISVEVDDSDLNLPDFVGKLHLLYDTDGDGLLSDETPSAMTDAGSGRWTLSNVNFNDGAKFTFASRAQRRVIVVDSQ